MVQARAEFCELTRANRVAQQVAESFHNTAIPKKVFRSVATCLFALEFALPDSSQRHLSACSQNGWVALSHAGVFIPVEAATYVLLWRLTRVTWRGSFAVSDVQVGQLQPKTSQKRRVVGFWQTAKPACFWNQ